MTLDRGQFYAIVNLMGRSTIKGVGEIVYVGNIAHLAVRSDDDDPEADPIHYPLSGGAIYSWQRVKDEATLRGVQGSWQARQLDRANSEIRAARGLLANAAGALSWALGRCSTIGEGEEAAWHRAETARDQAAHAGHGSSLDPESDFGMADIPF